MESIGYQYSIEKGFNILKGGPGSGIRGHRTNREEGEDKPNVEVFHGTSTELVDKIRKEGLVDQNRYSEGEHVFASPSLKAALLFGLQQDRKAENVAVFTVDSKRFNLELGIRHYYRSDENIPPEDIKGVKFYKSADIIGMKNDSESMPKPYKEIDFTKKKEIAQEVYHVILFDGKI